MDWAISYSLYDRADQITHKNRKISVNLRKMRGGTRFKVGKLKIGGTRYDPFNINISEIFFNRMISYQIISRLTVR